jgi:hypothetical protein
MGIVAFKKRVGGVPLRVKKAINWILFTKKWNDSGIWIDEDYWRD